MPHAKQHLRSRSSSRGARGHRLLEQVLLGSQCTRHRLRHCGFTAACTGPPARLMHPTHTSSLNHARGLAAGVAPSQKAAQAGATMAAAWRVRLNGVVGLRRPKNVRLSEHNAKVCLKPAAVAPGASSHATSFVSCYWSLDGCSQHRGRRMRRVWLHCNHGRILDCPELAPSLHTARCAPPSSNQTRCALAQRAITA
jgi:hypothetical protein